mgnify:CR=1 FL=1
MKNFSIKVQSTNGTWSVRHIKSFENRDKAKTYCDALQSKTNFPHKAEYIGEVDVVEDEETKTTQSEDVENTQTENVEQKEEKGTKEEISVDNSFDPDAQIWDAEYNEDDFPMAWWLRKQFVAKDGTVFDRAKAVESMYSKVEPS